MAKEIKVTLTTVNIYFFCLWKGKLAAVVGRQLRHEAKWVVSNLLAYLNKMSKLQLFYAEINKIDQMR